MNLKLKKIPKKIRHRKTLMNILNHQNVNNYSNFGPIYISLIVFTWLLVQVVTIRCQALSQSLRHVKSTVCAKRCVVQNYKGLIITERLSFPKYHSRRSLTDHSRLNP